MAASAGTVTLNLDANSVKMIRELQKAQTKTKRTAASMRKNMGGAFKTIAASAAVMTAAISKAVQFSVKHADAIGKTASAIGLTAEQYQELAFAAKRAGVEQSQFASNMTAFVKRVGEAKAGMGPLVSGLKNLNPILLDNLKNTKNQAEAFRLISDAIRDAESATEKAAIANAAFSRAGIGMVNMMHEGADGLDSMAQKARSLGVVLDNETIKKAEDAADKFGDLGEVLKVKVASTVLENADAIIKLAESITSLIVAAGNGIIEVGKFMDFVGEEVASQLNGVAVNDFVRRDQEIADLEKQLISARKASTAWYRTENNIYTARAASLEKEIALKKELLQADRDAFGSLGAPPTGSQDTPGTVTPSLVHDILPDPVVVQQEADQVAGIIKELMDDIATFGMSEDERVLFELIDQGATEEQIALIRQAQDEMRLLKEAEEIANAELEEIVVTAKKLNLELEESVGEFEEFGIQAARNLQTAFADFLFDPFDEGIGGMIKGFANMMRRMVAEAAAAAILKSIFGGMQGSDNSFLSGFATVFGGGRASGGSISAGTAYLVGEKGPELIIPQSSGMVVPNNQLVTAMPGGNITNIVNLPAAVQRQTPQQLAFEVTRIQKRATSRNS